MIHINMTKCYNCLSVNGCIFVSTLFPRYFGVEGLVRRVRMMTAARPRMRPMSRPISGLRGSARVAPAEAKSRKMRTLRVARR